MKRVVSLLVLWLGCSGFAGKVVAVHDGDTVKVEKGKEVVTVRLNGIDAPEIKQVWGIESKDALSAKVLGKKVEVEERGRDRYGRTVGVVKLKRIDVNAWMVESGNAWWYRAYAKNDLKLRMLEENARVMKKGLWSGEAREPWLYRKECKATAGGD